MSTYSYLMTVEKDCQTKRKDFTLTSIGQNLSPESSWVTRQNEGSRLLLESQCVYGIEVRGLVGRIEPEEDSYQPGKSE